MTKTIKKYWSTIEDMDLMKAKAKGLTHKEIGIAMERSAKSVECRWRELRRGMGKRMSGNTIIRTTYCEADRITMKMMLEDGYTQWQIANVLGRSESAIGNQLSKIRKCEV